MSKNRAASIRARLKNRADATKQDFNLTLTHYGLERLLYRLSVSRHAPNFLLKDALLFKLWYDVPQRPTRDADLLGFGPDDMDSVAAVFHDLCVIEVDDGIVFDAGSIKTAEIRKDAGYGGVRVELRATLDGAQISQQIDIGFGDVVTPAPETVTYPVLLDDLPAPRLRAYPKYTVVALEISRVVRARHGKQPHERLFRPLDVAARWRSGRRGVDARVPSHLHPPSNRAARRCTRRVERRFRHRCRQVDAVACLRDQEQAQCHFAG